MFYMYLPNNVLFYYLISLDFSKFKNEFNPDH